MKISKVGIDLIKSFEGCSLKSYKCPASVWTIGWGTTGEVDGVPIGAGMTITQAKADSLLINSLVWYENAVSKYVTYNINQNEYDALVSFAYNCGPGALQKSDLLKYLNQGKVNEAANQFDVWTRGGGKVLSGLVRRRAAEKKLFLTAPKYDDALIKAVAKLVDAGAKINEAAWNNMSKMNLMYAQALIEKIGALFGAANYFTSIDALVAKSIIEQRKIWDEKQFKAEYIRSLLIKAASKI